MAYNNPAVSDFKNYFVRDFPYGTDISNDVLDADIASAFLSTNLMINQSMWPDQGSYTLGYLYCSAHFLVENIRASTQGLNGQYSWLNQSQGAGAVNVSSAIPERILDNPQFSMFTKTNYGQRYLELMLPQMCGVMYTVWGTTLP